MNLCKYLLASLIIYTTLNYSMQNSEKLKLTNSQNFKGQELVVIVQPKNQPIHPQKLSTKEKLKECCGITGTILCCPFLLGISCCMAACHKSNK